MNRHLLFALLATLLPGLHGCSGECTAKLCQTTFALELLPQGGEFVPGIYDVTIDVGYLRTCSFTVDYDTVSPAECDMDTASVTLTQFSMRLLGKPEQVTVTMARDDITVLDETYPVDQPETHLSECHGGGSCVPVTKRVTSP